MNPILRSAVLLAVACVVQRFMGLWPDGTPITEPTVSDAP